MTLQNKFSHFIPCSAISSHFSQHTVTVIFSYFQLFPAIFSNFQPHQTRILSVIPIPSNCQPLLDILWYFKAFSAIYFHVLPYQAIPDNLQSFLDISSHFQSFPALSSHSSHFPPFPAILSLFSCCHLWPITGTFSHLLALSTIYSHFQLCQAVYSPLPAPHCLLQPFTVFFSFLKKKLFTAMYSHLQRFTAIS